MAIERIKLMADRLLRERERSLSSRPVSSIVSSLGRLSQRWLDKMYVFRKRAVKRMVRRSGYSEPMAEALLDALFHELTLGKLKALLRSELGDAAVLDRYASDRAAGVKRCAKGPKLITHIFAGNIPNPSILSYIFGMLLKSVNIGKVSSGDPGFLDIYLESLKDHDERLGRTNLLLRPDDRMSVEKWAKLSDLIVAYGNDQSLEDIRRNVPASTLFIGYGHKLSISICLKEALTQENVKTLARKTARDVWMADGRGCLSPRVIYLEKGGQIPPDRFCAALAGELERLNREQSRPDFIKSASCRQSEDECLIRQIKQKGGKAWPGEGIAWSVVYDDLLGTIPLEAEGQKICVKDFERTADLRTVLKPLEKYLQAASIEGPVKRIDKIAGDLSELGFNRICRAGTMQKPPLLWRHDGGFNLAGWVRWTDLEIG